MFQMWQTLIRSIYMVYLHTRSSQDAKRLLETFSESAHSLYTFVK